MVKIRRLNCFDYPKLKKLISYLQSDDNDIKTKSLFDEPLGILSAILPLNLKFKSESYILIQNHEILGLITILPTPGNPFKINITRLIFKENDYQTAKRLVDFIIQKTGSIGAHTFCVSIDISHDELLDLFICGCGFRQCSSEILWKKEKNAHTKSEFELTYALNCDAKKISELFNSELDTIFCPSLMRNYKEFLNRKCHGVRKIRFIEEINNKIIGYFSITSSDEMNYILDITTNSGYERDYGKVINSLLCYIAQNKKAFYTIIKQKKYMKESEKLEEYLKTNNFIPIQTRNILVKDYYKTIAEKQNEHKVFLFEDNYIPV